VKNKRDSLNQKEAKLPLDTIMHSRFVSPEIYNEFQKANLISVRKIK